MCNIEDVRAIGPAAGILIPEFDFVIHWDADEQECNFWCDVVETERLLDIDNARQPSGVPHRREVRHSQM